MFDLTNNKKTIIGLVHLLPLPGTPYYKKGDQEKSVEKALADVRALIDGGADGCLIQSVDKIYPANDDTDYARVAAIAAITTEVKRIVPAGFKIGVQLMWNCITPSLAVVKTCGAHFTRCSLLVGSTDSQYGIINADPLKVMDYRTKIDAWDIAMISEISGYHNLAGGFDKAVLATKTRQSMTAGANAIEVFDSDEDINDQKILAVKAVSKDIPVILGGGTTVDNCARRLKHADGALVGSAFENGVWGGPIYKDTVARYMENVRKLG